MSGRFGLHGILKGARATRDALRDEVTADRDLATVRAPKGRPKVRWSPEDQVIRGAVARSGQPLQGTPCDAVNVYVNVG